MSEQIFSGRVRVEVRDGIADVVMIRTDKHNGLDWNMFTGLVAAARSLENDRDLRAVILRGDGPSFCSGLDVASFSKAPAKALRMFLKYGVKRTNLAQEAAWCWRKLPVPVIAAIHGKCWGGGLQIALACDFRYTRPDAELSVMEIKWGLIPDMTGSVTLRELVPIDVAKELTMTGRILSGTEARQLNLVTGVADDPIAAAKELAERLKVRSPDAVAAGKALFHQTWGASEARALAVESRLQVKMFRSRNQRVAAKANFAKTAPQFGRRRFDP
jgi:enoyl-CoA hydratase/carnithine racemase